MEKRCAEVPDQQNEAAVRHAQACRKVKAAVDKHAAERKIAEEAERKIATDIG